MSRPTQVKTVHFSLTPPAADMCCLVTRSRKDKPHNIGMITQICDTLGCDIGDVCEIVKQEEN